MPEDHGPRAFEAGSYDVLAARLGHAGAYGLEPPPGGGADYR